MAHNIQYRGEIKQNATPVIYFNLLNSGTEADETGIAAITVYYSKNGGAATNLATPTFAEIDATNMAGVYELTLTSALTDTVGELAIYITAASCHSVKLTYSIVANIESDTYTRVGAPAGASIAVDIAVIDTVVDAVKVKTDQLNFTGSNINATGITTSMSADVKNELKEAIWEASDADIVFRPGGYG